MLSLRCSEILEREKKLLSSNREKKQKTTEQSSIHGDRELPSKVARREELKCFLNVLGKVKTKGRF